MKRGAVRFLVLVLGLAAAGCTTDDIAWLKYQSRLVVTDHRRAQTDRLLAACRECLVVGGAEALCRGRPARLPRLSRRRRRPGRSMPSRFVSSRAMTMPQ